RGHGVAVLEPHGFHAGGAAGPLHAAAELPLGVPGKALLNGTAAAIAERPQASPELVQFLFARAIVHDAGMSCRARHDLAAIAVPAGLLRIVQRPIGALEQLFQALAFRQQATADAHAEAFGAMSRDIDPVASHDRADALGYG